MLSKLALLFLCGGLFAPVARAELVDHVVYVVVVGATRGAGTTQRVITVSDVAFEREIDPYDRSPVPDLEGSDYPYATRLVDFAILRHQAGDVEVFRPSALAVVERWEAFRDAWPSLEAYRAFLARWGSSDEELKGFFFSRLVVERYVERSLAGARDRTFQEWVAELRGRALLRSPGEQ